MPSWDARAERWGLPLVLALAALAFAPALGLGFVYDDLPQLVNNPRVHGWDGLANAFREHVWAVDPSRPVRYYRPLFMATLTLAYQAFGAQALGYHGLSMVLHLACGALLWRLAGALGVQSRARALGVAIFLLHPLQIQAVTWVSAVSEPLLGCVALATLWAWLAFLRERRARDLALTLLGYAAAMLILERGVALAAPLLLLSRWYERHADARPDTSSPFARQAPALAAVALVPLAVFALRRVAIGESAPAAPSWLGDSLLAAPAVVVRYLQSLVLPLDLSLFYPERFVSSFSFAREAPQLAILLVLGLIAAWASHARPRRELLLLSSASLLAPALCVGLLPGHALVQDRYAYLPLAFFALWLGEACFREEEPRPVARLARGLVLAWLAVACLLHPRGMQPWHDEVALYTRAIEVAPESPQAMLHYAVVTQNAGLPDPGCTRMKRAAQLLEQYPRGGDGSEIFYELGNCLREQGDRATALRAYAYASAVVGGDMLRADVNRALLLAELVRLDEAWSTAQAITTRHADSAAAWKAQAVIAAYRGDMAEAQRSVSRSLALDPKDESTQKLAQKLGAPPGR